ncbi:MAG: alkaline phosphatase family protein [bacterium]
MRTLQDSSHPQSAPVEEHARRRLLVVALDCAERTLIEKWMAEGHLPNLQALRDRGAYGPMSSTADVMVATPWPTAMTSQWPIEHGFVCWMQWRPEHQDEKRCDASWVPWTPFYRRLGPLGKRVVAIDVPMMYEPEPFDGLEVVSWGSYDKHSPLASHPPGLVHELGRKYHKLPIGPEYGELQGIRMQLKLRDALIAGTEKAGDACRDLLRREDWDLFIAGFGAPHRAGHNFWDHSSIREDDVPEPLLREHDDAIRAVYIAADRQLGKLIEAAPANTSIVALATHGMGPTNKRSELLPEMLDRILHDRRGEADALMAAQGGLLKRVRKMVPTVWRQTVKRRLPKGVQDRIMAFWAGAPQRDWSQTRAFVLLADGSIRVNLKGRERDGVVPPAEFEPLLQQIEEGLATWKDEATGEPLVKRVLRGADLWPEVEPAKRSPSTPDLIVQWSDRPTIQTQRMTSSRYGPLRWPWPNKQPTGNSGHHVPTGWLMIADDRLAPGTSIEDAQGLDLAPTLMHLMGLDPFADMRGRVLAEVAGTEAQAVGA